MNRINWIALGACVAMLPACGGNTSGTRYEDPSAMAVLEPTQGSTVHGAVDFVRKGGSVLVTANLSGLAPNSTHGIHIHENGDCTARDGSSAGGHFNPSASADHGGTSGSKRHGGDLGNLTADSNGHVLTTIELDGGIAFGNGTDSIVGRGLVVHANADDLKSPPAGNSGARLACGIITRNPDRKSTQG